MNQSDFPLNRELVFDVIQEPDGGYVAQCLTEGIVTQGDSWEELRNMVKDAVEAYFFDAPENRSAVLFCPSSR
jgi:predicted RNase H-like HicB family nuclease